MVLTFFLSNEVKILILGQDTGLFQGERLRTGNCSVNVLFVNSGKRLEW
jgi:hypothetical protein